MKALRSSSGSRDSRSVQFCDLEPGHRVHHLASALARFGPQQTSDYFSISYAIAPHRTLLSAVRGKNALGKHREQRGQDPNRFPHSLNMPNILLCTPSAPRPTHCAPEATSKNKRLSLRSCRLQPWHGQSAQCNGARGPKKTHKLNSPKARFEKHRGTSSHTAAEPKRRQIPRARSTLQAPLSIYMAARHR